MKKSDGSVADLLSGEEVTLPQPRPTAKRNQGELTVSLPTENTTNHGGETQQAEHEVRLLKIPAGHQKLVRGRVSMDTYLLLFTQGKILQMADSVVEMGDDCFMTLIVQNHGTKELHLKKGVRLGTVAPVDVLTAGGGEDNLRLRGSGEAVVTGTHKGEMAVVVNRTGDWDAATP